MSIEYHHQHIHTLEDLEDGVSVFLRLDLNVPLRGDEITDDTRIRAALPTIKRLIEKKCKITIASHLGRPKGKVIAGESLLPVAQRLAELLDIEVVFPDDCIGTGVHKHLLDQQDDQIILLENLRFHADEEQNNAEFARKLKSKHHAYVSDAFGALHREHASTAALPKLFDKKYAGLLVEKELQALSRLIKTPSKPYSVVLGGAKISDKLKVVEALLKKADRIFLGGAMVFTFLKARGHRVGNSLVEEDMIPRAKKIMDQASDRGVSLFFPKDFYLGRSVEDPGEPQYCSSVSIPDGMMGLDIGPKTLAHFSEYLESSKTLFWNGPMGLFEKKPFHRGSFELATLISKCNAYRVVGGGDSVAAINQSGLADQVDHISTGGGASLEYIEKGGLPGLRALAS
ncbi:MAG: phosphoglycerate kinase [Bdellovibrionales bacterium]|nr:phosphoglycerate kinase [Bdellovibrionales bacterium]